VRGTTTPIGVCRKLEASVAYAARLPPVEPHLTVDPLAQRVRERHRVDRRAARLVTYDGIGQVQRARGALLLVSERASAG
jgi:hypothetical protein